MFVPSVTASAAIGGLLAAVITVVLATEPAPSPAPQPGAPPRALAPSAPGSPLPETLQGTGLLGPDGRGIAPGRRAFAPQYPLWSDGTTKRRWIYLPPGESIDAARPEAWEFPRGTRLWKEFRHGSAVETRFIERLADGTWRFATYAWNAAGTEARLAPREGTTLVVAGAPQGRYRVPSRDDCRACHEGPAVPVLGFSALQLSPDRDPLAPHADAPQTGLADLRTLAADGVIRNLPDEWLRQPPRIAGRTPVERAALGYLHGNCGHCHDDAGALAGVGLALAQHPEGRRRSADATLRSLLGHASRFQSRPQARATRVAAGDPTRSVLALRMRSTSPLTRMPPLGVEVPDEAGIALVERWITHVLAPSQETRHASLESLPAPPPGPAAHARRTADRGRGNAGPRG